MTEASRFGLPLATIDSLRAVFERHTDIEQVTIYGSRVLKRDRPGSDIDLTIVGPSVDVRELLKIENEIDDLLIPYKVDLSLKSKIEDIELINHIDRVGQVFYQRARD